MAGWLTLDEVRDRWRDAPADDEYLQELLDLSAQQVAEFGKASIADTIADTGEVPNNYRVAQLAQTRNTWNGIKQDPSTQGIGDEGFVIYPVDLTPKIQKMIRPRRAKPVVA